MAVFAIRQGQNGDRQAYITGNHGKYDGVIKNRRLRYARNAISNFEQYALYRMPKVKYPDLEGLADFSDDKFERKMAQLDRALDMSAKARKSMPPIDYTLKYLPKKVDHNTVDTLAVIGAAFEDMGKRVQIGTAAFTKKLQKVFNSDRISADVLDLNKDGKIDVGEYASSILAADMLSKNSVEMKSIDGTINQTGHFNLIGFLNKRNDYFPSRVFQYLHDFFALDRAKEEFLSNPNNMVK